jgi:hypothetical protein
MPLIFGDRLRHVRIKPIPVCFDPGVSWSFASLALRQIRSPGLVKKKSPTFHLFILLFLIPFFFFAANQIHLTQYPISARKPYSVNMFLYHCISRPPMLDAPKSLLVSYCLARFSSYCGPLYPRVSGIPHRPKRPNENLCARENVTGQSKHAQTLEIDLFAFKQSFGSRLS